MRTILIGILFISKPQSFFHCQDIRIDGLNQKLLIPGFENVESGLVHNIYQASFI